MSTPSPAPAPLRRAALLCAQMLPATLLVPAIRALFAARHHGDEGAMHAFMSVNMLAAAVVAPFVIRMLVRWSRRRVVRVAAILDALLLASFTLPLPTQALLALRLLEGAAHVTTLIALLTDAGDAARQPGGQRTMAAAGAGLVAAIAFGSLLGTALLAIAPLAPFLAGAALAVVVAALAPRVVTDAPPVPRPPGRARVAVRISAALGAAFVSRFAVGSLVVTFALFAHRVHHLSDAQIGLCFSALTVPFALATFPLTALCRRVAPRTVVAIGVAGYAIAMVALAWVPTAWLVPVMLLGGVASAAVFGAVLVEAAAVTVPAERAHAMGLINGAGCLGMLLGPPAAGIISALVGRGDPDGYRAALVVAGGLAALWVVAHGAGRIARRAPATAPSSAA